MVLDLANGVTKGEGGCLLLQHVWSSAVEEHDWEAPVHSCENEGEHCPVVECNRHNWCSVGVTTSFPTCLEMSHQSQLLQWRKMGRALSWGTPHRKCWLLESQVGALSVHVIARFPRYRHCVRLPCHWYGMWLAEDESFYEIIFLHFQLISSQMSRLFTCWCKGLHQSHLVWFKT